MAGISNYHFSSVQSLSLVWLFATPWIAAHQASLSITNSWSSLRLTSIESVMPSSHLILCCPLFSCPQSLPASRVFSNEATLRMRWLKYWSFSFSTIPSKEHPGLISFRMDWLDNPLQYTLTETESLRLSEFEYFNKLNHYPRLFHICKSCYTSEIPWSSMKTRNPLHTPFMYSKLCIIFLKDCTKIVPAFRTCSTFRKLRSWHLVPLLHGRETDGETVETLADFILGGSKITVDGDCSHDIKRRLLLGKKVMTNLDSILKSRDITLPSKVV